MTDILYRTEGHHDAMDTPFPLNEDVLFMIFDALNTQSDVLAMMSTCWPIYYLGVKSLLRMGANIVKDTSLVSFCHFMGRNLVMHGAYLTRLRLAIPRDAVDDDSDGSSSEGSLVDEDHDPLLRGASLLVPVLKGLTNLQILDIDFCDCLLQCDGRLMDAIAALQSIRELRIAYFGLRTYNLISSIRSPIVRLYMDCMRPELGRTHQFYSELPDPLDLLKKHKETLEDVSLCYVNATALVVSPGPSTSVYPRVRSLTLSTSGFKEREILVDAFPNLRVLDVTKGHGEFESDLESTRARNRTVRCWAALEHVYGDIGSLYKLGLTCPVGRLDVALDFIEEWREELHEMLSDLLWAPSLERVVFRLGYCALLAGRKLDNEGGVFASDIINLLPQDAMAYGVTHLGLDSNADLLVEDPSDYQMAVITLLSRLNVKFFTFRMHVCVVEREGEYDHNVSAGFYGKRVLWRFQDPFLLPWAIDMAEAAPTVEFLCFEVMHTRTCWQVKRHSVGNPFTLVLLSEEASSDLVRNEGMEWHHTVQARPGFSVDVMVYEGESDSDDESDDEGDVM